jgi:hypothetical protein
MAAKLLKGGGPARTRTGDLYRVKVAHPLILRGGAAHVIDCSFDRSGQVWPLRQFSGLSWPRKARQCDGRVHLRSPFALAVARQERR